MIPRVAHFVFGLEEQHEPFHFLHYASLESCRRVLAPKTIYFHHKHLPWGPWWERIRPYLTMVQVDHVQDVVAADYSSGSVPAAYRYAHHADFLRLDALIERGGVYADIDTIFLRPFPDELFEAPFVIGREAHQRDEHTGELRPSLCNALLMAEPGSAFAQTWRAHMAEALNGTWSNHSGFLSQQLTALMPSAVRVEPAVSFFAFPPTRTGVSRLLTERHAVPAGALSAHLWAHLWWDRGRQDFSQAHGGWCIPAFIRGAETTAAELLRPYLAEPAAESSRARENVSAPVSPARRSDRWSYLSIDEDNGYGIAADRCIAGLEESGLALDWTPFVHGASWGLGYQPAQPLAPNRDVVVSHLVAEYLPHVRRRNPESFLVAHTVWDTNRIPDHWTPCLDAADLIVVPSRFSADAIARSAVLTPVAIVPHVATPAAGRAAPFWAGVPDDVKVFYTIGEWTERKAVFRTIEAYLRAFTAKDRVLLIVKTSHLDRRLTGFVQAASAGPGTSAAAVATLLAKHADPPPVRLITRALTSGEITALHRRGDCFISLSRAEGWGLGAFDAAAEGTPVVSTGYGGQLDYLTDSPYLVGFDLVPVHDPVGFPSYAPEQRWAEPDLDHGAALLRDVAANSEQATAVAAAIGANIRRMYRPAAVASAFRAAVEQHRPASDSRARSAGATRWR